MNQFILLHRIYLFLPECSISFQTTFTALGTARQLPFIARTKIPIVSDQSFSRHLQEHLISLITTFCFAVKTDTGISVK